MKLGVCYYPEHWPESRWAEDAQHMQQLGISVVRVGEFSWSRLEPTRGDFQFDWLQRAIDVLHHAGLEVVLGTPTATPPKWLIDEHPSILAVDEYGNAKGFGSRRHYCFSSTVYREECQRIVLQLLKRFAHHKGISTWQTDNEYGCHSTIASYSQSALTAFRQWCEQHYGSIEQLNKAWGNVFWSMEYSNFAQIELPMQSVTELNPAHRLAFWRFSSDQVASFNKLQTNLIKQHAPQCDVMHNFMGNFTEFDHYTTAKDLDIAAWDNYPLGFLDRDSVNLLDQQKWYRTGHPDSSAFHHDLYRGMGRLWIIEQQPGPVNWAPHNPAPLAGMLRLWALEAMAHGAELMSWFRWRQAPFAQEQMHTGLLLPDGSESEAIDEVKAITVDLQNIAAATQADSNNIAQSNVAMIFDYAGDQMLRIQPQGDNYGPLEWVQQLYTSVRRCGVNVDILSPDDSLDGYQLVILANSLCIDSALCNRLKQFDGHVLVGPRCGSKTSEYSIALPSPITALMPVKVTRVESLPDFVTLTTHTGVTAVRWREKLTGDLPPEDHFDDGWGFYYRFERTHYLNACLSSHALHNFLQPRLIDAGITPLSISMLSANEGLRLKTHNNLTYAFNYGPGTVQLDPDIKYIVGEPTLAPAGVAVWVSAAAG